MSMGVGESSRGGRGVAAVAAEVVDDATKLTPGRLPPKHEAIPAEQESKMLQTYIDLAGGY